jgi:hypothetical protein
MVSDERSYLSSIRAASQVGSESLSACAVGSCGVPAASFPTSDRVGSFVYDGVLAVVLASDVSLHDVLLCHAPARCRAVADIGRTTAALQVAALSAWA